MILGCFHCLGVAEWRSHFGNDVFSPDESALRFRYGGEGLEAYGNGQRSGMAEPFRCHLRNPDESAPRFRYVETEPKR